MSCLVKSRHPNGTCYVYESESRWDPEKRMSVPKRHLVGKIDPVTGKMVPTGKRGRPRKDAGQNVAQKASAIQKAELGRLIDEMNALLKVIAEWKRQQRADPSQAREETVSLQTLKMQLLKAAATVDEYLTARQQSV
ncbi:hypothetical protein [uncultured Mailhella sp.]|uniref:hypothetical protein n=1 Tax=uncultured Mailhella sp. TaxID=1981031 RepID=UPI00260E5876|nr:hypothetical protein [uncultured Mailhella sp.]